MHRSGASMAWNVFKFCTALRGLGSVMILLVLGVVSVTYYTVVLTNYGPALYAGGLDSLIALLVLILFHSLLVMLLWSYFSVVLTDPGGVPPNWRPAADEERGEADALNGSEFSDLQTDPSNQRVRYCRKCNQLKPPRCHHCSVCGRCILKMDHHLCMGCKLCWGVKLQIFSSFPGSGSGKERIQSPTIGFVHGLTTHTQTHNVQVTCTPFQQISEVAATQSQIEGTSFNKVEHLRTYKRKT